MTRRPHPSVESEFPQLLASDPWVCCAGGRGRRLHVKRWLNLVTSPMRHRTGFRIGRAYRAVVFAIVGLPVQWLVDRFARGIAVENRDGRAGLHITATRHCGRPAWLISDYWAWPLGHGHGRVVLNAVLDVADRTGTQLTLRAGNSVLAQRIYRPAGFDFQPGQEHKGRPRIVREPVVASIDNEASTSVPIPDGTLTMR